MCVCKVGTDITVVCTFEMHVNQRSHYYLSVRISGVIAALEALIGGISHNVFLVYALSCSTATTGQGDIYEKLLFVSLNGVKAVRVCQTL